jgi:hypothetical protein
VLSGHPDARSRSARAATAAVTEDSSLCAGCRLLLPVHNGPTHAYLGGSAACWDLYQRFSAPPYARDRGTRPRRLVADAYAVQHPGRPQRRSVQSVAVHLMGLCLLLEPDGEASVRPASRNASELRWLTPPEPNGTLTIADCLAAELPEEHDASVEAWAENVWAAWSEHHEAVRGWLALRRREPEPLR